MTKLLIAAPVTLFMLAISAVAIAFGTAPTPGVTFVGPGSRGTVATTAEQVAACRIIAAEASAQGLRGPDLIIFVAISGAESRCTADALGDMYQIGRAHV